MAGTSLVPKFYITLLRLSDPPLFTPAGGPLPPVSLYMGCPARTGEELPQSRAWGLGLPPRLRHAACPARGSNFDKCSPAHPPVETLLGSQEKIPFLLTNVY